MLYACDHTWWREYFSEIATRCNAEEMWTVSETARDQFKLHWVYGCDQPGLSKSTDRIHTGLNSGYQAISLAVLFGAKRVLLIGYDFMRSGAKSHWHGDHPKGLGNGGQFPRWVQVMDQLALDAKRRDIEIVNCSRRTALGCFRKSTIQAELPV